MVTKEADGMTEDQAKTKWCPMVRVAYSGGSYNRNSLAGTAHVDTKDIRCIGSDCMMWGMKYVEQVDERNVSVLVPDYYCGLAGKP